MRIEWVIVAEGVAQDSRGALTVVGLNQNVFAPSSLPSATRRVLVTRLIDVEPGDYLLRAEITDPDGRVLAVESGNVTVQGRKFASLPPGGLDLPVELQFPVTAYGTYEMRIEVTQPDAGARSVHSTDFYVVPVSELIQA